MKKSLDFGRGIFYILNMKKTINIPERRYALFADWRGDYLQVISGNDLKYAHKWGNFIRWVGGIKKAETRTIK